MIDLFSWLPDLKGNPALLVLIAAVSFALSFIGAAVGLVLGHFRLPLLIAYFGNPVIGAATNLVVSGIGALAGAAGHLIGGRVSLHCLLLMGVPSLLGAGIAAWVITWQVSHFWSHLVIGLMLVYSGYNLLQPADKSKEKPAPEDRSEAIQGAGNAYSPDRGPAPPAPESEPPDLSRPSLVMEILIGLVLGGLAALTGLMLGSLRLPLMLKYLRIDPKVAVGSNMAIGCLTALAAAAVYFANVEPTAGVRWDRLWLALAAVVPPTVAGGLLGVRLTGRIGKDDVRRLAGWAVVATGAFMAVQAGLPLLHPKHRYDFDHLLEDDDDWPWDFDDD
ncbi:MAG: sulfite exporter TauE/SafE family protein [Gemmataceae bacterium]|nr:sulfite exporter TauE/SafE family protein [Gemmataceae bacterium]